MLNYVDIKRLLDEDEIKIEYSFLPSPENQEAPFIFHSEQVSAKDDEEAIQFFENNLVRNRVGITLGPLLMPYGVFQVPKKIRFGKYRNVVDLRKCPSGYKLKPRQEALIFTNEYVSLSPNIGAIILSRVTNYFTGLTVQSSYIDSTWSGLLKLIVRNGSDHDSSVYIGQKIGRLFFFSSPCEDESTSKLLRASPHYGLNWSQILGDIHSPFFATDRTESRFEYILSIVKRKKKTIGISLATLIALISISPTLWSAIRSLNSMVDIKKDLSSLKKQVQRQNNNLVISGKTSILGQRGESLSTTRIDLPRWPKNHPTDGIVILDYDNQKVNNMNGSLDRVDDKVTLVLITNFSNPLSSDELFQVSWSILP